MTAAHNPDGWTVGDRVEIASLWLLRPYGRPGSRRYNPGRHATGHIDTISPRGILVVFDCGLVDGEPGAVVDPAELTRIDDQRCRTPRKRLFRSQADANRWWRDAYWRQGKPRLYPYTCAGHWHLTSQTPEEQARHQHRKDNP